MELLYVWIEEYNNIKRQGFNFSPKHRFHFEPNEKEGPVTGGTLTHNEINTSYPDNFFGEHISNITAIVGKNGSGKSSLIKAIGDAIHFIEKIVLVYKYNGTFYYWKNIPYINNNTKNVLLIEDGKEGKANIYLGHVVYYSPFINSNRNYLFDWSDARKISSMERMANVLFSVANNPNSEITAAAPKQIYHHFLSAYCAQEMTTQINFIKEIADSKFQIVPETIAIPQNVELGIPFYANLPISLKECPDPEHFTLYMIVDALNRKIYRKAEVRSEEFSYSLPLKKVEVWLEDICKNRGYDIKEIKKFCNQFKDKNPALVNYGDENDGKPVNFTFPYLSLPQEILLKQDTGTRSSWAIDLAVTLTWHDLSDGEATMLSLFARLWEKLQKIKHSNIILLDEFELGLHPQWQKEAISRLIKFFELININKHHLILTSHSPFLVSDLPRENVIFLDTKKNNEGIPCCKVCEPENMERTFGANIHSLYRSSFFMDGLMGKFAEGKINDVIADLKSKRKINSIRKAEIRYIIDMIGEDILRYGLERMYVSKFKLSKREELELKREEINRQLQELEKHDSNKN